MSEDSPRCPHGSHQAAFVGAPESDMPRGACFGGDGWNADGPVMDGSKDKKDIRVGFTDAVPSNRRLG
jgi:hypothetical protein